MPNADDRWMKMVFSNNQEVITELYYGSGYLSQSSRKVSVPANVSAVFIEDYKGKTRKIDIAEETVDKN